VAAALLDAGHDVTVLTRSVPSPEVAARLAGARLLIGDAADPEATASAVAGADRVVYAAGATVPADAEHDPVAAERVSLPPLLGVLDACRRRPGTRLLFLSSGGTVYGDGGPVPIAESHPLRPTTTYGRLKAAGERSLAEARAAGVAGTALRCANVYGPGQAAWRSQGVIATLLAAAAGGDVAPLYGDGRAVRDHVAVDDVAGAVVALLAADGPLPPAVNVGSGVGTSLAELVALVGEVTGRELRVRWLPDRPTDRRHVVLDVSLLARLAAFRPTRLRDGIAALWARTAAPVGSAAVAGVVESVTVDVAVDGSLA
jgi:UDP-glucose 4-epimerase